MKSQKLPSKTKPPQWQRVLAVYLVFSIVNFTSICFAQVSSEVEPSTSGEDLAHLKESYSGTKLIMLTVVTPAGVLGSDSAFLEVIE